MTPEQLQQIEALAEAINAHNRHGIVEIVLICVMPFAFAIFWVYISKRLSNLADSNDLKQLTKLVEDVKSEYTAQIEAIKAEYAARLEDYREELKRRSQAARVAEFLALAFDRDTTPKDFNRLAWEISLWLPAPMVCDISRCLAAKKDRKTPTQILIDVRRHLLQSPDDPLQPDQILWRDVTGDLTGRMISDPMVQAIIDR